MEDLNDMLYFAEVADRGGFAAAARALGVPRSRLSRRISELETRLGARLLQRTTRKLSLTEAGERCHRHCVSMREQAEAAVDAVAHIQGEPRGTLRVACAVTLAQTTVGPLLPLFLARYPQVRIDMRVSNRVVDLVEEGVDVALRVRPTLEDSGSLVVKNLGLTQTLLVASPAQLARQGRPSHVEELGQLDTVSMAATDGRSTWQLVGPDKRAHTFVHQARYVADDLLTLKFAILRGTGMGILPDYMCHDELRDGLLQTVLPEWAPPAGVFHAVFPSRRGLAPATRRFLDFLGTHFATNAMLPPPDGEDPSLYI
jgi:DNA-binding transcriptional LysR family regulator